MEILSEIQSRQSIRSFTSEPVDEAQLNRILEAGRLAPSAKNRQPWRFIVIKEESLREKIKVAAFNQEHVGQAPIIIILCSTNIDYRMPNGQYSYPIDISFATSFMMIQAEHEGLNSCIISTFDETEIKDLLTVPYSMKAVMMLLVGHAADVPIKEPRKALKRISAVNHW